MQNGIEFNTPEDLQKFFNEYIYKNPSPFNLFNKAVMLDFDTLIERLKIEFPELKIGRSEVERYTENGYFPEFFLENGEKGFMIHTTGRIDFIKKIIEKWGYNKHEIKKITEYEDYLIDDILTSDELDYSDLPSLPFFIKYLKNMISENKIIIRNIQSLSETKKIKKQNKKYGKYLKFFQDKEFKDLPLKIQKEVNDAVLKFNQRQEELRLMMVLETRAKSLLGFSPWVRINMQKTANLDYDSDDDNQFPYIFNYSEWKWFYGKWKYDPKWISPNDVFFATPEFYIGYGDNNTINISIRDTQKVDSHYLREIEKYYNRFRNFLKIPKKKWGEKSGKKKELDERDRHLKETYKKLREQMPTLKAERHIEKAIDEISIEYGVISPERAQRIIYSKKKK